DADGQLDDRGPGDIPVHPEEVRHGLYVPVTVYSLIEHAQRARLGRSRADHLRAMAALFAGFSRVAAATHADNSPSSERPTTLPRRAPTITRSATPISNGWSRRMPSI